MMKYIKHKLSGVYGIYFVLLLLLNLSQICSYYHTTINKFILSFCVVGVLHCIRNRTWILAQKGQLLITTLVTTGIAIYFIMANTFHVFLYYNYTIGLALVIYGNLYVALITKLIKEGKRPSIGVLEAIVFAMFACIAISVNSTKLETLGVLFFVLPLFLESYTSKEKIQAFKGMIDGTCCAFILGQLYSFGFQHYMYYRYAGYFLNTTYAGLMYMYIYVAFLCKYVITKLEKGRFAGFYWGLAVFVLSLLYLTGGRSPVLGIMLATAVILLAWQWLAQHKIQVSKWILQCVVIGCVSVALFPVSYAAVRYLPTIIDKPDYSDSVGNRYYSPMRFLFDQFEYDGQYQYNPNTYEVLDIEYVDFYSALYNTLGRIVPKGTDVLEVIYKQYGITDYTVPEPMPEEEMVDTIDKHDGALLVSASDLALSVPQWNTPIVSLAATTKLPTGRGSSAENPWFLKGDEISSFDIRSSIHRYTLAHLNWFGHESTDLEFHMIEEQPPQPHPHNVFLMYGYNYGIPTMICFIAMILLLLWKYAKSLLCDKQPYALYGLCTIATTVMFGMFEYTMGPTQYILYVMYLFPFLLMKQTD